MAKRRLCCSRRRRRSKQTFFLQILIIGGNLVRSFSRTPSLSFTYFVDAMGLKKLLCRESRSLISLSELHAKSPSSRTFPCSRIQSCCSWPSFCHYVSEENYIFGVGAAEAATGRVFLWWPRTGNRGGVAPMNYPLAVDRGGSMHFRCCRDAGTIKA